MEDLGCAFGRFQMFHNGHLEHVLWAKAHCVKLIVWITNPDISIQTHHAHNQIRWLKESNPFTYNERKKMIELALLWEWLRSWKDFEIKPFPIHDPIKIEEYIPRWTTMYISALDGQWSEEKIKILSDLLWQVERLPFDQKPIDATTIRTMIRNGNEDWRIHLPWSVLTYLVTTNLIDKIISLP